MTRPTPIKMNQNTNIEALMATRTIFMDAIEVFERSQIPGDLMQKVLNAKTHFTNMVNETDSIIDQITKYKGGLAKKNTAKKKVTKKKKTTKTPKAKRAVKKKVKKK